jgi:hypothetical protein
MLSGIGEGADQPRDECVCVCVYMCVCERADGEAAGWGASGIWGDGRYDEIGSRSRGRISPALPPAPSAPCSNSKLFSAPHQRVRSHHC